MESKENPELTKSQIKERYERYIYYE